MNLGVLSHEVQSAHRGSEKSTTRTGFLGTQTFSSQSSEEEPVKTKRPRENGKRRIKRQWYHTRQVKKILQGRSHQLYNATDRSSNMRTQIWPLNLISGCSLVTFKNYHMTQQRGVLVKWLSWKPNWNEFYRTTIIA